MKRPGHFKVLKADDNRRGSRLQEVPQNDEKKQMIPCKKSLTVKLTSLPFQPMMLWRLEKVIYC
jgi:hypothetical protein